MLFTRSYIQGLLLTSRPASTAIVKLIEVYTDGSCYNGDGGYAVYFPGGEHPTICKGAEAFAITAGTASASAGTASATATAIAITSTRCEMLAVNTALTIYNDKFRGIPCTIYTDSSFIVDSLYRYFPIWRNNGWKKTDGTPVKNQDLMKPMCKLFDANKNHVSVKHIKAHTLNQDKHSRNNAVADVLAKNGAYPCKLVIDALSKCSKN
jgi:ribonuclease HI